MILELGFFAIAFVASIIAIKAVSGKNQKMGVTGTDVNKLDKRELPESAGIALLIPLWIAIILFNLLVAENSGFVAFGLAVSVLSIIGFFDDRKHKFKVQTISWTIRAIVVFFVCMMFAMFFAPSVFWLLPFALFIAIIASFQNTFAGLNGWEVGSGLIISGFIAALLSPVGAMPIGFALVGAIAGLFLFNAFPAKVFPGDSGTILIGSSIACLVILNQNRWLMLLALLFFLPHAFDFFCLKLLTNKKDMSQSKAMPYSARQDGKLTLPLYKDGKTRYDFAKLILKLFGPMEEWKVVAIIWAIVAINCFFWVWAFKAMQLI